MPTCHACGRYYSQHSRHCPSCYDDHGHLKPPPPPQPVETEFYLGQLVRCTSTTLGGTGVGNLYNHAGRIVKKNKFGSRWHYLVQFDLGAYYLYGQDLAPALAQPETTIAIDNTGPRLTVHINHHRPCLFTNPTPASRKRLNSLLGAREPKPIGPLLIYTL